MKTYLPETKQELAEFIGKWCDKCKSCRGYNCPYLKAAAIGQINLKWGWDNGHTVCQMFRPIYTKKQIEKEMQRRLFDAC